MILLIDNYDSFVHTLARYVTELGEHTNVVRNDVLGPAEIRSMAPKAVILSPGPKGPLEAGRSIEIVKALSGEIPLLGVCLGHQSIATAFGLNVVRGVRPFHGCASRIRHEGNGLFRGLADPLTVGRYHSLVSTEPTEASALRVTARDEAGVVMGLSHRSHETHGVQFHPESILTQQGHDLLRNFLT